MEDRKKNEDYLLDSQPGVDTGFQVELIEIFLLLCHMIDKERKERTGDSFRGERKEAKIFMIAPARPLRMNSLQTNTTYPLKGSPLDAITVAIQFQYEF